MRDTAKPRAIPTALGVVVLLLAGALLHARIAFGTKIWESGALSDTDSYTRLLRVLDLWHGGRWFDPVLPWIGAPDGLALHWTRPLDILMLVPGWIGVLAGAAPEDALYWSAALVCPVLHLLACLAAVWAARALWPADWSWLAGIVLLLDVPSLSYGGFGRSDHHTLILLCGVVGLGFAARAAAGRDSAALPPGLVFGLGVWVSPEALLFALPALAACGLLWLRGAPAATGARMAAGLALVIALALPLERGAATMLLAEPDRISVQHLALAVAIWGVFVLAGRLPAGLGLPGRMAGGGALSALAAGTLLAAWPELLHGPAAAGDGELGRWFVNATQEMQPLRFDSREALLRSIGLAGGSTASALALLLAFAHAPRDAAWRGAALVVALAIAACLAAALHGARFTADLSAPAAMAGAGLIPLAGLLAGRVTVLLRLPAMLAALAIAIFAPMLAIARQGASTGDTTTCDGVAIGRGLAGIAPAGHAEAARSAPVLLPDAADLGPILAFHARLRLVSGPYHQLGAAFADTRTAFGPDEAAARDVVARRQAALVLVCPGARPPGEAWPAGGLRARLLADDPPGWLEPRPLPAALHAAGLRLYAVR